MVLMVMNHSSLTVIINIARENHGYTNDLFIRLCRVFQFSQVMYYTASAMIKSKRSILHRVNEAVHSVKVQNNT